MVQSDMILSLLEIDNKIQKGLFDKKGNTVSIKKIIMLREDILNFIKNTSSEADKLQSITHEIDWGKYPNLLKQLLENRFIYILELKKGLDIEKIWQEYFDFNYNEHPFKILLRIIVCRPRDMIYLITRIFESAINNGNSKATKQDLNNATKEYLKFFEDNIISETVSEFPNIRDIITKLKKFYGETIEYKNLIKILKDMKLSKEVCERIIKILFKKQFLAYNNLDKNQKYMDYDIFLDVLSKRFFFFFRKKVNLIINPKYQYLKT